MSKAFSVSPLIEPTTLTLSLFVLFFLLEIVFIEFLGFFLISLKKMLGSFFQEFWRINKLIRF